MATSGVPIVVSPPGGGSGGSSSAPIERPCITLVQDGTALRPSVRLVGRVNGQPTNVPATDKGKALVALDRLLDAFLVSAGGRSLAATETDEPSPIGIVDVWSAVQVLIANSEQVNARLAAIEEHLAGVENETPPPVPTDNDSEFWQQFMSAPDPDPETFEPEAFESYSRGRVLYQWRAEHTPTGVRIYPAVSVLSRMTVIRAMYEDQEYKVAQMFRAAGVEFECAVYAILSGRCDSLFDTGFGARPLDEIRPLAGKSAADLFARDIAGATGGGTPSGNEG